MSEFKLLWKEYVDPPKINLINIDEFFSLGYADKLDQQLFAWDLETSGLDIMADVFWARSVSFHNDDVSLSVQIRDNEGGQISAVDELWFWEWISKQTGTIAHNATYECGVGLRATGKFIRPVADTYILFKDMASEGFLGQTWSLDFATTEILDWPKYSAELDQHLKDKKLKKSEMCHADWEVLGKYNQLDAAATWELYKRCCTVILDHKDTWGIHYWDIHKEDVMALLELQVLAYREGLRINKKKLLAFSDILDADIAVARSNIFSNEKIAEAMLLWEQELEKKYQEAKPKIRTKKNGELHGTYINSLSRWEGNKDRFFEDNKFNLNSPPQLKWLVTQIFHVDISGDVAIVTDEVIL